jgi:hypothetical protein
VRDKLFIEQEYVGSIKEKVPPRSQMSNIIMPFFNHHILIYLVAIN